MTCPRLRLACGVPTLVPHSLSQRVRRGQPGRLFDDLSYVPKLVDAPLAEQADALRGDHQQHLAAPDVALEVPISVGKTLPALLVPEWRRRSLRRQVLQA